jgi:predicted acylesterase/phospholipase RssA
MTPPSPARSLRRVGRALGALTGLLAALALGACTTLLPRSAVPEDQIATAAPYGIADPRGVLREWGDSLDPQVAENIVAFRTATLRRLHPEAIAAGRPIAERALLLSGGGPDGAFGAGLLNGWTARGDRPEFQMVTGISTGAIIALFAYLGPDYDKALTEIYTTYTTDQLLRRALFSAVTGGSALTDTSGYRRLIEKYVDDEVVRRLGEEQRRGRVLLIGTTNIDAARPVIWNVAGIASTGHPNAKRLIHDIIQASSAIPAAFPPVIIPVTGRDGARYDEMHVDGGATQQVMYFSPSLPMTRIDEELGVRIDRTLYAVINNKLQKPYNPVRPRLLPIAGAAASSLIGGSGGGDLYKIFAMAERDGSALNVLGIPRDFDMEAQEPFDPVYMKALYDLGYEYGLAGDRWLPHPPDFAPGRAGARVASAARR